MSLKKMYKYLCNNSQLLVKITENHNLYTNHGCFMKGRCRNLSSTTMNVDLERPDNPVKVKPCEVKKSKFVLKTPKGTRDYGPSEMVIRRKVFNKIVRIFNMHGAVEIETPVFELKEFLTGKYGEDSKLIYDLEDQGGEILSMRYDLTVPFARYVAMNKIATIKKYQIARVYRRDNPSITQGRYREFYQCDFDIAGKYDSMVPDAECVEIMHQVLDQLNLGSFTIKVNHRKILDGLFETLGVPSDKFRTICSAVDKMDKCTWEEVRKEMVNEKGLDEAIADQIGFYVKQCGGVELLEKLSSDSQFTNSKSFQEGVAELLLLFEYCKALQCEKNVVFDLGLARGLDYYTGAIYEAVLREDANKEAVGSIAGGGRYDDLVGMFDPKGKTIPCVGVSFGIERIFAAQERKDKSEMSKLRSSLTQVFVVSAGGNLLLERMKLVAELRANGLFAETSYKGTPKFLKQLQYAEENCIPLIVLVGESEINEGAVKIRDTVSREEEVVQRSTYISKLSKRLSCLSSD